MEEHRKAVGMRAARLRDARGLSQEELARAAELSTKTVSRFENGRHDGRTTTVRRIAKALGVTEAELVGPPPEPLGLGAETQLDRIERQLQANARKMDAILGRLNGFIPPGEALPPADPPGALGPDAQGSDPTSGDQDRDDSQEAAG